MTDHGEQPVEARRAPAPAGGVGLSFAEVWGAASATADPYDAPYDPAAESAPPVQAGSEEILPASIGATDTFASAGQAVSVTVSRPVRPEAAPSGSAQPDGDDRLTVEIRREGGRGEPGRSAERIVVTVSLNQATEQVAVTF